MHKTPILLVVLVLGAGVAAQQGLIPTPDSEEPKPAAPSEPPASGPGLSLEVPRSVEPVLDGDADRAHVTQAGVHSVLASAVDANALGKHLSLVVERLGAAKPVLQIGEPDLVTPASTLKLLTTVAALHSFGPDHRFETRVVRGRSRRSVVLVGGGDPLLTGATLKGAEAQTTYPMPASLQDLARKTAAKLEARGATRVRLMYDASLFTGPAVNPHWEPTYVPDSVVSPISALWVDEGRETRGLALRVAAPAAVAATRFATYLTKAGVTVRGAVKPGLALAAAREVAAVSSPTLAQIVQHVIEVSDNEGAETLLRQLAIGAGKPGSSTAGVAAMKKALSELGIDMSRATVYDGSGLSRQDVIPISVLADTLQVAAHPDLPDFRSVMSSLPVAGFTGSLIYRFIDAAPDGLGVVRAKTGTLSGVHGLAGVVMTRDGGPLVFAAIADQVRLAKTLDAIAQLDKIAALLATCGC